MIAAEGEHKASRALRHAAEVITGNPAALQVWVMVLMTVLMIMMVIVIVMVMMLVMTMMVVIMSACLSLYF